MTSTVRWVVQTKAMDGRWYDAEHFATKEAATKCATAAIAAGRGQDWIRVIPWPVPQPLSELAERCLAVVESARSDLGHDLKGSSMLDLVCDQIPDAPMSVLRSALIVSGLQ